METRMSDRLKVFSLFLLLALCTGCVRGLLYTDVVRPVSVDMKGVEIGEKRGKSSSKFIREPVTRLRIAAEWDSTAIADAARTADIKEVSIADLRTQSFLLGVWRRDEIILRGK